MRLTSVKGNQKPSTDRRWRSILSRKSLFLGLCGGSVLLGGMTGVNWGVAYSQRHLAPTVTRLLQETLDRPIQLGEVEQVSLTHLRIGASTVPATPTDRDVMTVEAIEIQFNPVAALWQRRMNLTVTLIRPVAFFDQDDAGNWSKLELEIEGDEQVEVKQVRLRDATITLAPRSKALKSLVNNPEAQGIAIAPKQVTFQHVNLNLALNEPEQLNAPEQPLKFNLAGQSQLGGSFSLRGKVTPDAKTADLKLETDKLAVASLNPFLPVTARLDRGQLSGRLHVAINSDNSDSPIALNGKANLNDLAVQVAGEPNLFTQTSGQFRFRAQEITVTKAHTAYGQIPFENVRGTVHLQKGLNLQGRVAAVSLPAFLSTFDLDVPFATEGRLQTTDLQATGPIDGAIFSGTVHDVEPVQLDRVEVAAVDARFTYDTGADRLSLHKVELFPQAGGVISSQGLAMLGEEDKGEPDDLLLDLAVRDLPGDAIAQLYGVTVPDVRFGSLNAKAKVAVFNEEPDVQLQWQLKQATLPAQGEVILAKDKLRLQNTQLQVADRVVQAEGELADNRWRFAAQGTELPLQRLPGLSGDLPGEVTGKIELEGRVDRPLHSTQGTVQTQINTPEGTLRAAGSIRQGRWQGQIHSSGLALSSFSSALPGILAGDVALAGTLTNLNPEAIQAQGQIQLSEGISRHNAFLNQPLTAAFRWSGDRLEIQQAKTAGLELSGWIAAQLQDWQHPTITDSDLAVRLQNYDLATIPLADALPIVPQGTANFRGRITGTPHAPSLSGNLQLHQLAARQLAFESLLAGDVNYSPQQGLNLNLRGKQDQIALRLDDRHRLTALTVRLGTAIAEATTRLDTNANSTRILGTVQNFPLEKLHLSPGTAWGTVAGLLSGRFNVALGAEPTGTGEIAIDRPTLSSSNAAAHADHANDRFVGKLRYADRTLMLSEGNLQLGTGQYHLAGQLTQDDRQELTAQLTTTSGNLRDLVTLISPSQWQTALLRLNLTQPQLSLNFIQQFFIPQSAQTSQPGITDLSPALLASTFANLQGSFSTQLNLHHSQSAGLVLDFNLQGQDWRWGAFGVQQVTIGNSYFNGEALTLAPVQLRGFVYTPADQPAQVFDATVSFDGQLGERHSGQFHAEAIPAALLGRLFNMPIPLSGNLQATATLAGSTADPQVNGTIETTGIHLNARQIKDLQVLFQYNNHQFQVDDWRLME